LLEAAERAVAEDPAQYLVRGILGRHRVILRSPGAAARLMLAAA